ncbi:MAG TPA: M3 family metallopeptidase [Caulobacteraceae bacterium]|jgi:peptidyl-dipeptidase Dcp
MAPNLFAGAAALALASALSGLAAAAPQIMMAQADAAGRAPASRPAQTSSSGFTSAPLPPALAANPVAAEWTGPYGGVPAFDKVTPAQFGPAFEGALALRNRDIEAIANNPAPPTFDNTIGALERAGEAFSRMSSLYGIFTSSMNDAAMQKVETELAPRFAAAQDEIILNGKLFRRIDAVYNNRARLTPEQQRLTWRVWTGFTRQGAKLTPEQKVRLKAINQELANLYAQFSQKVLADEATYITVEDKAQLAGVPQPVVDSFAAAATEKKLAGQWIITNTRSSVDPFLTYASNRDLRQKVWTAFKNRGDNGDAEDTNATIAKIMPLRQERAKLLGFPNYAAWKLSDKMAATPERAMALMNTVWTPTKARIAEEVADMQAIAAKEGARITIEPWDYLFYAEKVRKAKYDLDQNELKPYFELNKMIEGSMWMANKLYGLNFKEVSGKVPVFHPGVRVWEVYDGTRYIGLFYGDYFAREGKRSGAWENAYRSQSNYGVRVTPLVSNNNNFVKGAAGEPVLISLDDAETLFHEFGHALHDLMSNVTYEGLAGTNVSTDFVEFPSQVHENWVLTPEILDRFARHYKTGQPMPKALLDKVNAAKKFNQGYTTGEYLTSALVDMKLHMDPTGKIDADAFERTTMQEIGAPRQMVMRHRLPHFNHVFADDGYAAGYYSYLWSDTMGADAWKAFEETGNVWDPATAAKMKHMLSEGDTKDQAQQYREFRGRDPDVNALLEQRGFPTGASAAK